MGAGCYYTHNTIGAYRDRERAVWVELGSTADFHDENGDFDEVAWQDHCYDVREDIREAALQCGYDRDMENGFFKIEIDSTYYGCGFIIRLESRWERQETPEEVSRHALAQGTHGRAYNKLLRKIKELTGLSMSIATGGYSAATFEPEPLKPKKNPTFRTWGRKKNLQPVATP